MIILRMALDDILSQIKKFVISVLLIAICMISIIFIVVIYKGQSYAYDSANDILLNGFSSTGFVSLQYNDFDDMDIQKFIDSVSECEEISAFGDMEVFGTDELPELTEIQSNNEGEYFSVKDGYLEFLSIDYNLCNLCEINVATGKKPEELDFSQSDDGEIIYLYLGNAYKTIPVGTKYSGASGITYVVAGIMEKEQRWIEPLLLNGFYVEDLDCTIDCSNAVFCVEKAQLCTNGLWIKAEDGYTVQEAIEAAYEVAKEYNIDFTYATLQGRYEEECNDILILISYLKKAFEIIIPAIILMLISMQIVAMMFELRNYGIMCSLGFSLKDINTMLIVKNVIASVLAFIIAVPVIFWIEDKWFEDSLSYIVKTVMINDALPYAVIILLISMIITSVTATVMLRRHTLIQLLGNRD